MTKPLKTKRVRPTVAERFEAFVMPEPNSGCHLWLGSTAKGTGYGRFTPGKGFGGAKTQYAHRVSWLLHCGPIGPGMLALHTCDNRACVAPHHLFLGTNTDNMADASRKGRLAGIKRKRLRPEEKAAIRANRHEPLVEQAKRFGISVTHAVRIRGGHERRVKK